MSIKIHERHTKVVEAQCALTMAVVEIIEKHQLTFAEVSGIILGVAQDFNKQAIRHERHPDGPGKGGDEA